MSQLQRAYSCEDEASSCVRTRHGRRTAHARPRRAPARGRDGCPREAVPCARVRPRRLAAPGRRACPREAASCARVRPPAPAHARPRRAPARGRVGLPRVPTRGRVVRPREAATARRVGSPREPTSRGSLPASCGSPACLLRLQIPSALAVAVQRASRLVRERRDRNERIRGILVFFPFFFFVNLFLGLNVSPTNRWRKDGQMVDSSCKNRSKRVKFKK